MLIIATVLKASRAILTVYIVYIATVQHTVDLEGWFSYHGSN